MGDSLWRVSFLFSGKDLVRIHRPYLGKTKYDLVENRYDLVENKYDLVEIKYDLDQNASYLQRNCCLSLVKIWHQKCSHKL